MSGARPSIVKWGLAIALLFATPATSAVTVHGTSDCGEWVAARGNGQSIAFEHYLLGLLNGLSLATDQEFWEAGGQSISAEAAYLWIDNYCKANPFHKIYGAGMNLFTERAKLNKR